MTQSIVFLTIRFPFSQKYDFCTMEKIQVYADVYEIFKCCRNLNSPTKYFDFLNQYLYFFPRCKRHRETSF